MLMAAVALEMRLEYPDPRCDERKSDRKCLKFTVVYNDHELCRWDDASGTCSVNPPPDDAFGDFSHLLVVLFVIGITLPCQKVYEWAVLDVLARTWLCSGHLWRDVEDAAARAAREVQEDVERAARAGVFVLASAGVSARFDGSKTRLPSPRRRTASRAPRANCETPQPTRCTPSRPPPRTNCAPSRAPSVPAGVPSGPPTIPTSRAPPPTPVPTPSLGGGGGGAPRPGTTRRRRARAARVGCREPATRAVVAFRGVADDDAHAAAHANFADGADEAPPRPPSQDPPPPRVASAATGGFDEDPDELAVARLVKPAVAGEAGAIALDSTLDDDEADDEGAPDAPGEDPGDLPWRECFDDARGRNYFFNVFTGESRWRPPAAPYVPYSPRRAERGPADAAGPGDSEALGPALVASSGSFLWRRSEGSRHRARGRHRSLSSLNRRLGMLLRGSVPWQTSRPGELNANPHAGARSLPFLGERSTLPAREFIPSQKEASSWRLNSKRVAWPRHRRGTEKLEALPPPVARPPNRTRDLLRKTSLSGAFGKPACLLKQARELAPAAADAVEARRGELRAAMVAFAARGDARGARAVWLLHELERDLVRKWGLVDGDRTATLSAVAAELLRRLVIVI